MGVCLGSWCRGKVELPPRASNYLWKGTRIPRKVLVKLDGRVPKSSRKWTFNFTFPSLPLPHSPLHIHTSSYLRIPSHPLYPTRLPFPAEEYIKRALHPLQPNPPLRPSLRHEATLTLKILLEFIFYPFSPPFPLSTSLVSAPLRLEGTRAGIIMVSPSPLQRRPGNQCFGCGLVVTS